MALTQSHTKKGENFYPFLAKCSLLLHDAIHFVVIGVIDIMTSLESKKDHAVEGSVGKTVAQPGFIQDDKLLSKYLIKVMCT